MATAVSYPGVYIQEIPSGVHTITAVATSIGAFVGRAARGPVNEAVTCLSFSDFQTNFGGLWNNSNLGFAVNDFFANGGTQAVVVRLFHDDPGNPTANPPVPPPATTQTLSVGPLEFVAISPGTWGVNLRVTIDQNNIPALVATSLGLATTDLFNLTVVDTSPGGATEYYANLTVKDSPYRVDNVLLNNSNLILYDGAIPNPTPVIQVGQDALGTLETAYNAAVAALAAAQAANPSGNVSAQQAAVQTAYTALQAGYTSANAAISDGLWLTTADFLPVSGLTNKQGIYALEQVTIFNLLYIPPYHNPTDSLDWDTILISAAATYCEQRRAMLLVDAPKDWTTAPIALAKFNNTTTDYVGTRSRNAALYFPRLNEVNPLQNNQIQVFGAGGAIAGLYAQTDGQRGVWKAPAGQSVLFNGISGLSVALTDAENGTLNPVGINCLRSFPGVGPVVWGARTLRGGDQFADEYKYIPVRRTALFIESSLYLGLQWAVFEPNADPLWAEIRLNVGSFMQTLFRQGAFQGTTAQDAYFVKCDSTTNPQNLINQGIVTVVVGFAPLQPAEFVVIQIQQIAGQGAS
jgi:phage tail sheath protein FI